MDGIHDLGGVHGFGSVEVAAAEPVFNTEWERRTARAMMGTLIGLQTGSAVFRHSIERMDPAHYLTSSYYEHWLTGVSTLLVEAGLVSEDELERRAGEGSHSRVRIGE